jgi:WD40 repeat protein
MSSGSPVEKCTLTGHSNWVTSVAWNEDGTLLASGSCDETVKIWDMSSGSAVEKCTLKGHSDWVKSVAWSPDGKTLASGSEDATVRLWDAESGEEKGTLKGHVASWQQMDAGTKALATKVKEGGSAGGNRSGQYIVTAEGDMVYVYLATSEGEKHGESLAAFRSPSNVAHVCCRGTCVVVGCDDGQVRMGCEGRVATTVRSHFPRLYCTRAA